MHKKYVTPFLIALVVVLSAGTIDLNLLPNYENQSVPGYINKDNTTSGNDITDEEATLGRILFYDKSLSVNDQISCASCHKQEFAFGDTSIQSTGVNGLTGRHSTRLVNTRFADEVNFFWDERAATLEEQSTMPIQDHIEMGFSGTNGDPSIDSLITKLEDISYYQNMFTYIYGDATITETKIQNALAQFVRSIQSFDSKYDLGRDQVNNNMAPFPNFTPAENAGKILFMSNPNNNGAGCNACHRAPEFDIDPNSDNNGVIGVAGNPSGVDVSNTRSPSLRDMVNPAGELNGQFMHDGSLVTLMDVIDHYDDIPNNPANTNLDNRLNGPGGNLNLTTTEKQNLEAFLLTLTGTDMYTNEKWSDPFDANGDIIILNGALPVDYLSFEARPLNEKIELTWMTLNELDNEGWEIQRSEDGLVWYDLDFVYGQGQSDKEASYTYLDRDPITGRNYYRLKQFDLNGRYTYSEMVSVLFDSADINVSIYPNPTSDFIKVNSDLDNILVKIYDSNGSLVRVTSKLVNQEVNVIDLRAGVYIVQVLNPDGVTLKSLQLVKI